MDFSQYKIAIVCDWLLDGGRFDQYVMRLCRIFPHASLYTSVYMPRKTLPFFQAFGVKTGFIQKLPFFAHRYRLAGVWRWLYFKRLDLTEYDIIISSSSAEAKSIKTNLRQLHIDVCHSPSRYYWDRFRYYSDNPGNLGAWGRLAGFLLKIFIKRLRKIDYESAQNSNLMISISQTVKNRIKQYYKRESLVVYPGVEAITHMPKPEHLEYVERLGFVVSAKHISSQRLGIAINACNQLQQKLIVLGDGPLTHKLKQIAGKTIEFKGNVPKREEMAHLMRAKGYLYTGEDDFAFAAVEAMSVGTPVIALASSSAKEVIVNNVTGIFFAAPLTRDLRQAILNFNNMQFNPLACQQQASKFTPEQFKQHFLETIQKVYTQFNLK